MVFAGYSGFLNYLQLASHALNTIGINVTKNEIPNPPITKFLKSNHFVFRSGPNQWRDAQKPKQILEDYCKIHHLTGPMFYGNNGVKVGNRVFNLGDFGKRDVRMIRVMIGNSTFNLESFGEMGVEK